MTSFPKQATPPVSHLCSCPPTAQLQLPFLANHHQPKAAAAALWSRAHCTPDTNMAAMSRHHHDPLLVLSSLLSSLPRQRSNEPTRPLPSRVVQKQKPTRRSAMAGEGGGRLPLDLSLATAGPSAGERRPRARPNRRTLSSLYAELGAMLPNLPIDRVSPCPRRPCFLPIHHLCVLFDVVSCQNRRRRAQPASKEEIVDAAAARVKVLEDTVAVLETYHSVRSPLHGAGAGAEPRLADARAGGVPPPRGGGPRGHGGASRPRRRRRGHGHRCRRAARGPADDQGRHHRHLLIHG